MNVPSSKRMQKATEEDKRTILTMWANFAKTRAISQQTGMSESYILQVIRKAAVEGIIEERRIYHEPEP